MLNELPNARGIRMLMQGFQVMKSAILCSGNTVLYSGGNELESLPIFLL